MATQPRHSTHCDWGIASIVDLEIAVESDKEFTTEELTKRDKVISKEIREAISRGELEPDNRRLILWQWLEERKAQDDDDGTSRGGLGSSFWMILQRVRVAAPITMAIVGAVYAFGALSIKTQGADSVHAVNARFFWLATTALPLVLTLVAAFGYFKKTRSPSQSSSLFAGLLARMTFGIWRWSSTTDKWRGVIDTVRLRLVGREGLIGAHFLSAVYSLGLAASVGIWIALCMFDQYDDQVYGWKSHQELPGRAESIARQVAYISLPWSGFAAAGTGFPSLEQVRASRLPVNKGTEAEEALREARGAWINFFKWSVLVYGVLPRLLLYGAGRRRLKHALNREQFNQERFQRVCRRLTKPGAGFDFQKETSEPNSPSEVDRSKRNLAGSALLLVPDDFDDTDAMASLISQPLQESHHLTIDVALRLPAMPKDQATFFEDLKPAPESVLLLQEAFVPPTEQYRRLINNMRQCLGPELPVRIVLVGQIDGAGFRSPSGVNLQVWEEFVGRLVDPNLSCLPLHSPMRQS